jgi:hypothetical protein
VAGKLHLDRESNIVVSGTSQGRRAAHFSRPGLSHSIAGFLSTIINIYTACSGFWSRTAIATAAATGTTTAILLVLFLFCERLLKQIKDEYESMRRGAEDRGPRYYKMTSQKH